MLKKEYEKLSKIIIKELNQYGNITPYAIYDTKIVIKIHENYTYYADINILSHNSISLSLDVFDMHKEIVFMSDNNTVDNKHLHNICGIIYSLRKQMDLYSDFIDELYDDLIDRGYRLLDTDNNVLFVSNTDNSKTALIIQDFELSQDAKCKIRLKLLHYNAYTPTIYDQEFKHCLINDLAFFLS